MFDLAVIGGGPAGYLAAERAAEKKLKVILFEKDNIGGVCLNEGCIPSKALLYSAKLADGAKHGGKYGVHCKDISLNHAEVIERKKRVIETLVSGIKFKLKKLGVEIISGQAIINGRGADGFSVSAKGDNFTAKQIIVASGSEPVLPPIDGLKESLKSGFAVTNREILSLKSVPKKLVVVGGGVIGLEMASYYNSAGSDVTVIEMLGQIGGQLDTEISGILQKNYEAKGIKFLLNSKVVKIADGQVGYEQSDKKASLKAENALISIGRKPVVSGFGLENIKVNIEKGAIATDDKMQTNIAGVYAAGDCNGKSMLAHTAYREAEVAVNNILGQKDYMNYSYIPAVIYTNPEVAVIGLTEEAAKTKGLNFKAVKLSIKYSGRYLAENEGGDGIIKFIVNADKQTVLGCHLIGNYSSEIISTVAVMAEMEMKLADIKKIVFPHPTVAEIIREAVFEI